ncbi:hypothetical protein DPMN_137495 [Dreissena polymorpha]|uniref:Uncharacterized protein n=1 Tax=Dreissena polymorpha TaxID=45954 RepID=A0A9D4G7X8_DREPO|nr:hypothetical protein DPMN_137495 [Dreissena polymorpha]
MGINKITVDSKFLKEKYYMYEAFLSKNEEFQQDVIFIIEEGKPEILSIENQTIAEIRNQILENIDIKEIKGKKMEDLLNKTVEG